MKTNYLLLGAIILYSSCAQEEYRIIAPNNK